MKSSDERVWKQLSDSALGRVGGALAESAGRAASNSALVGVMKKSTATFKQLAPGARFRAIGVFMIMTVATHIAMMVPQRPAGMWWLIVPSIAGAFGATLVGLSYASAAPGGAR